jgi:hypothetical protein
MSKESVATFVEAISASPQLMSECRQTFESPDSSGFLALARRNGFDVTAEEAVSLFRGLPAETKEIGEGDLEHVSGGGDVVGDPYQISGILLVRRVGISPAWFRSNPVSYTPIQLP